MKAGTTSLQRLLDQHPDLRFAEHETHAFSLQDFEETSEHWRTGDAWADIDALREEQLGQLHQFADTVSAHGRTPGLRSTTALTATGAPELVRRVLPEADIIVCLRDPVDRCWSHYWHLVRTGRAVFDFRRTLTRQRGTLLKRSTYAEPLREWRRTFREDRVHLVFFEELVRDPDGVARRTWRRLGLEDPHIEVGRVHAHRGRHPARLRLALASNWIRASDALGPATNLVSSGQASPGPRVVELVRLH